MANYDKIKSCIGKTVTMSFVRLNVSLEFISKKKKNQKSEDTDRVEIFIKLIS